MKRRGSITALADKDPEGNDRVSSIGKECKQSGERFVDHDFPADDSSIWKNPAKRGSWLKNTAIEWRRPDEIGDTTAEWNVFKDIEPDDIKQGQVGDCYFLAALGSVATRPELIDNIIIEEYAKQGVYGVKFFQMGKWRTIVVDDLFPCVHNKLSGNYDPLFASYTNEKEIWMMVCEKAWAKMNGSYQVIANGMVPDMLVYLTGGFREMYQLESEEAWNQYVEGSLWDGLYSKLKNSSKRDMLFMSCGGFQDEEVLQIGGHEDVDQDDDPGLMGDHAYSVLDMIELPKRGTRTGKLQLIQIRNPWGSYEWTGDYGDDSPLWTKELKRVCGYVKQDDGAFWMNFEDFCDYFTFIGACLSHPDWESKSIWTSFKAGLTAGGRTEELFKYNPTLLLKNTSTNVVIQIEQDDIRDNEPHHMFYFDVFLNVIQKKGDERNPNVGDTLIGTIRTKPETPKEFRIHSCQRITSIWMDLPIGEYYIVVTRMHGGFEGNCAINMFSEGDFELTELDPIQPTDAAVEKMAVAQIQKDPSRPTCCITGAEIDLMFAKNYVVKKGVFWDISKKKRNFRCAECLRSFDKEAPFYDIAKRNDGWAGYCQRCFKSNFFPMCISCDKAIFNTEECNNCNGEFIRVGDNNRVHEQCWNDYMLKNTQSNLVCPYVCKHTQLEEGKAAVVVRCLQDQPSLDKLKQFVDDL